jgi:hypothetical protein
MSLLQAAQGEADHVAVMELGAETLLKLESEVVGARP